MIILLALLLFFLVRIGIGFVTMSRKHFGGSFGAARRTPSRRRGVPAGSGGAEEVNPRFNEWTLLDDIQLNRLLKDSAPRHNG